MKKMYISDIESDVMISFAKSHINLVKAYKITPENEGEFCYTFEKVGTYRVVRVTHGTLNKRNCVKFVFRDYMCNIHGNLIPTPVCLNEEWRQEMIKNLANKKAYIKEFNAELDKELEGLKEDYEAARNNLENQRLSMPKIKKESEEVEEM